jgi:hypothetical protein
VRQKDANVNEQVGKGSEERKERMEGREESIFFFSFMIVLIAGRHWNVIASRCIILRSFGSSKMFVTIWCQC